MNQLKKLFSFIKDRYTLPKEAKSHVSKRNARTTKILLYILMAFSSILLVIRFLQNETELRVYLYYSELFVLSLITFFVLRIAAKKNNYYLIQSILMILICLVLVVLEINISLSTSYVSALIASYLFFLLIVICFDLNPLFYSVLIVLFVVLFAFYSVRENLYLAILGNNLLFGLSIIILALYKRSSLVKRNIQRLKINEQNRMLEATNIELEHQKDYLLLQKQNLEEYAYSQSEKLLLQHERIIRIQNNTIVSLSSLVENRDEDTGNHVLRTRDYVELIAINALLTGKFPELNEETIKLIIKAAPMHDIGKIVVPDAVLKKPGKLTPEEFELIKLHTTKGGKIVEDVLGAAEDEKYVKITKEIAVSHHEKYDGSGYPYGLKGEAIPLSARIMSIADVFDALVSPRCYKSPFPLEDAFKIIKESAGTHFDPVLAQLFVESKDKVVEIYNKYK